MKQTSGIRICVAAMALALICGQVTARPHRRCARPAGKVVVVSRPAVIVKAGNSLTRKERFAKAMAYLGRHKYISIRRYAKMTGLSMRAAEAELDAFAKGARSPLRVIVKGKKKLYVKG